MRFSTLPLWWSSISLVVDFGLAKVHDVVPRAVLNGKDISFSSEVNWTDSSLLPRALFDGDVDPRDAYKCVKLCGPDCCHTKTPPANVRRAPKPFENDISGYSQAQLAEYIIARTNPGGDDQMKFVYNDLAGSIEERKLQIHMDILTNKETGQRESTALPMPTTLFLELDDKPVSLAMASLIGCTTVTWVSSFIPGHPTVKQGVWMSHIWEQPGMLDMEDSTYDEDDNPVPGTEFVALAAQQEDWVLKLIEDGFPTPTTPNRGTKQAGWPDPEHQEGAGEHLNILNGGSVFIMTPDREIKRDDEVIGHLGVPQYVGTLARMKARIKLLDDTAQIDREFIYKANRNGDTEELRGSPTGRVLFEYVPNRDGIRYGRLLMEDGGDNKIGLKEFNFGPAST